MGCQPSCFANPPSFLRNYGAVKEATQDWEQTLRSFLKAWQGRGHDGRELTINRKEEVRAIKSTDKDEAIPSAHDPAKPKKIGRKRKEISREDVERRVRKTLLSLMRKSKDDAIRISAAKVLIGGFRKSKRGKENDEFEQAGQEAEQTEAIGKARELLVSFAEAKSCCVDRADQVDRDGAG